MIEIDYETTMGQVLEAIGGELSEDDCKLLIDNYPSYELEHRKPILECIKEEGSPVLIAEAKIRAKGIDPSTISPQARGGHVKWATAKMRRLVRRLIYLRSRIKDKKTRRQANQFVIKNTNTEYIDKKKSMDSFARTVRKDTQGAYIDKKYI